MTRTVHAIDDGASGLLDPVNPDALVDAAGSGELAFVAYLVRDAVYEASRGDREARRWLERCAIRWLRPILDGQAETVVTRLLAALPDGARDGERATGAASEWVQLGLWGRP